MIFHFLRKGKKDPMVDTHILVKGFGRNSEKKQVGENTVSVENSSPGSKADFQKTCTWYLEVNIE